MTDLYYVISKEIFEKYPGYSRGVVLAFDVKNDAPAEKLAQLLREAEESVRCNAVLDKIAEHPRIKPWREAYKAFGAKPSEFRSSIEAMARRVLREDQLPNINPLVDIGNIISLRRLVPIGGHAIDKLEHNMELRLASGEETFEPFGTSEIEHPLPGEVVFCEGDIVLTRRWTWRQANRTLTLPETTAIEFNIDALPMVTEAEIHAIAQEVMAMVQEFCGGCCRYEILTKENPRMSLGE
ncbi:MAG: hypothetical protein JW908_07670 [Anaerolineales bacterium]|nr:hypothetical protein [Anaerolineales bacterium]